MISDCVMLAHRETLGSVGLDHPAEILDSGPVSLRAVSVRPYWFGPRPRTC